MTGQLRSFAPDADATAIIAALGADGAVVLTDALTGAQLEHLRVDAERELEKTTTCDGVFLGYQTKRVATMVAKSDVCKAIVLYPSVLRIMDHFLLPHCDRYQLNLSQLIAIGPGERRQIMHADDPMFPFDHGPEIQVMINTMWMLDDFTTQNGATHIAPGSHSWPRDRQATDAETIQAEAPAGSCLVWLGSTRHGGGANLTSAPRRGIVVSYNLGWLKQGENPYLSIPLSVVRTYPPELQRLIGYFVHRPNLNCVEGRDPIEVIDGQKLAERGFKDHMPAHVADLLQRHYDGEDIAVARVESERAVGLA